MTNKEQLDELKKKMAADKDLPMQEGATNLVFGDGNPEAKILLIGEGPGYWEDMKGIPFVGNAGKLLDRVLGELKIDREQYYITNVVHYRLPNNRDPEPSEIAAFGVYLNKMIDIISPEVIITLGRFSMGKFMPGVKISQVHGKPRTVTLSYGEVTVVPMYHPAAALRNGNIMSLMKDDYLIVPEVLDQIKKEAMDKAEQMQLV